MSELCTFKMSEIELFCLFALGIGVSITMIHDPLNREYVERGKIKNMHQLKTRENMKKWNHLINSNQNISLKYNILKNRES